MTQTSVALIGCGQIARHYAESISRQGALRLSAMYDIDSGRAQDLAGKYDAQWHRSLDDLLSDHDVDVIVNLTPPHAHHEITAKCLEAGFHTYSEKPLASTVQQARELVGLARHVGVRLACAPAAWLGAAQQNAVRTLAEGVLGRVRAVYADVNQGRIEQWHREPRSCYEIGPVADVGLYPLSLLVAALGPVQEVWAWSTTLMPHRTDHRDEIFSVTAPDFVVACLRLRSGVVVRMTATFYVDGRSASKSVQFHGDEGSLSLGSWLKQDADLLVCQYGEEYRPLPVELPPDHESIDWSLGVLDLAQAIQQDRECRVSGRLGLHLVEVCEAITVSARSAIPVKVEPVPLEAGIQGVGAVGAVGA